MSTRIALLFFLLSSSLFAQENEKRASLQAPFVIDGLEVGLGLVTPNDQAEESLIEIPALIDALEAYLDADLLQRIKNNLGPRRFISAKELSQYGLTSHFDSSLLNLEILIPTSLRRKTSVDLMGQNRQIEKHVYLPAKYSGWVNVNLTENYNRSNNGNYDNLGSNFQLIQNAKGFVLEANTNYQSSQDKNWTLGEVRLVKDQRNKMVRYTLGDLNYPVRGFQLPSAGGGLSVTREYSISPRTVTHNLDKTTLTLKRPSQVEIFLNGSQLENVKLPPGPVDLSNYPFASGRNEVLIKVTDDLGHVETFNYSTLFHSQILRPGYSEFNYSLEFPQTTNGMSRYYRQNDPKISAFYNQGISPSYTAGLNLQADEQTKLAGLDHYWLSPIGLWTFVLGGSYTSQDKGAAERLEYQSLERWSDREAPFLFRSSLEFRSESFRQIGAWGNDLKSTFDIYASRRLPWNSTIGTGASRRDYRTREDQITGRADYSQNFGRSWQWGVNYSQDFNAEKEKRVLVTFSWSPPGSSVQSYNTYESTDQNIATQWRYQAMQGLHNVNTMASASRSNKDEKLTIQADYAGPLMEGRIDHQNRHSRFNHSTDHSGQANLRFATVWTNRNFGFSRPINDAFAIVDAKPRPRQYQIPIGAFSNFNGGTISKYGPAVVTNIQPYMESNMALDIRDLPVGQVADQDVFTIIPPYKGGVDVTIEIQTRTSISAQLHDVTGKTLNLKTGRIFNQQNIEVASFFSNREGRIYVDEIKAGSYRLEIDESNYAPLSLTVPSSEGGDLIELGTLTLTRKE